MAPLKRPKTLRNATQDYVQQWLIRLVNPISSEDQDGRLSDKHIQILGGIRDFLEPWLPVNFASEMVEHIFQDPAFDTAFKFGVLQVLYFPERTTKLALGKHESFEVWSVGFCH